MDAPKRIWINLRGSRWVTEDDAREDHGDVDYLLAAEHDRIMAEKEAQIAHLEAKAVELEATLQHWRKEWDADHYDLTARAEESRDNALDDAAAVAERDCDWLAFGKAGIEQWDGGPDAVRDYRLGIRAGRSIAAAIRAMKGE